MSDALLMQIPIYPLVVAQIGSDDWYRFEDCRYEQHCFQVGNY